MILMWRPPCDLRLPLVPDDQVRVISYEATFYFQYAMISLNLKALRSDMQIEVSLELLRRLRDREAYDETSRFMLAGGIMEGTHVVGTDVLLTVDRPEWLRCNERHGGRKPRHLAVFGRPSGPTRLG